MITMKHIYSISATVLLALSLLLGACNSSDKTAEPAVEATTADDVIFVSREQFESNDMALGSAELKSFPDVLQVSGIIDVPPENRASVSAIGGGFVRDFTLLIGDKVRKGQKIVSLENPEFVQLQQQYLENLGQLPYLKSELERQKTLFEEKISSEKLYLQAESQYRMAVAKSLSLERQLELLNINPESVAAGKISSQSTVFSPLNGYITKVNVQKGTYVSPATEIVEIIDSEHLHLELTVFEKDIQQISVGQAIWFSLPEISNTQYKANVHLVGTALDENRTVKVHAHLKDESETNFLVGMFVRASIELDGQSKEPLMALPETAVIATGNTAHILVLEQETAEGFTFRQVEVEAGTSRDSFTALQKGSGLQIQDKVLVRGAFNLISPP